jgi:hypothetical protein
MQKNEGISKSERTPQLKIKIQYHFTPHDDHSTLVGIEEAKQHDYQTLKHRPS